MRALIVLYDEVRPLLKCKVQSLSFPKHFVWVAGIEMCTTAADKYLVIADVPYFY